MSDESIQRPLITGGAGFIGSNFVHYLSSQAPSVHPVVFDALTYAANVQNLNGIDPASYDFVCGDIRDGEVLERVVSDYQIDAIVNFAAESHNDNSIVDAAPFISTNVVGTYTLLELARRHNLRFHQVSTDEVYGDLALDDPGRFTESSPYRPSSPYSASKAAADHLVRAWFRTYGVRVTLSNCSNNYGPRQHVEKFIPRQITNILDGRRPRLYGDGSAVRDWIGVEDDCSAIWTIVTRGQIGQTYLIGANGEHSNREVLELILQLMGRPGDDYIQVADRPGGDRRYALDASKLTQQLDWQPKQRDFTAGLAATIDWYRVHRDWWQSSKARTEERYLSQGH